MVANGDDFSESVRAICKQVEAARKRENLVAVGINCIHPSFVSELFKRVHREVQDFNLKLVVYPNSGEIYTVSCDCFHSFIRND